MPSEADPAAPQSSDVTRRTWLAAERTWLAWWRTGIGASAVAIGVGRVVPELTHGARWPWRVLGVAYGAVAVAVLVLGAIRQQRTADALRRGSYSELSSPLVLYLTAAAVILALGAVILVAVRL
jgi:putative membrane protein